MPSPSRRTLLAAPLAWLAPPLRAAGDAEFAARLREGGCIVAFRHALAPGTFDPPGFRVEDCSTQRNLSDEGREQARRIGAWFAAQGLRPARVRSSPWCRCLDTARLAFAEPERWTALASPRAGADAMSAAALAELRAAIAAAAQRRDGFEAWVTHQFVLTALVGGSVASGEALVLAAAEPGRGGAPRVLARRAFE